MKKLKFFVNTILLLFLITFIISCFPRGGEVPTIKITVENPLPIKRTDVPIVIKLSEIKEVAKDFSFDLYIIVPSEKPQKGQTLVKIPSQADDMDYDGVKDELVFLVDLEPEEVKTFLLHYPPEDKKEKVIFGHDKRTKTGIFPELGGAALESESAAYIVNNSVIPMAKSTSGLMLNKYVKTQNETEMFPLIPKNENDFIGCGGFALWENDSLIPIRTSRSEKYVRVLSDGPIRSAVEVIYPNYKVNDNSLDIRAIFSIIAGHREMKTQIKIDGDALIPQLSTGLPFAPIEEQKEEGYAYNWNLSDSNGTAIIYPKEQFVEIVNESSIKGMRNLRQNPTLVFDLDTNNFLTYYTLAVSAKGDIGVKDQTEFENLIDVTASQINSPPSVEITLKETNKEKSEQK